MSGFSLIWSNLFRRKARTFLTLFSIIAAFLLFGLLRSVADAFDSGVDVAGVDRLSVSPKYSIIDGLPISHLAQIAAVPGVAAVTHSTWFGGIYQNPANFFPKFPIEPRAYFGMYDEYIIDPAQLDEFERIRTAAVAPVELVERYGWQIGDRIPIQGDIWLRQDGSRLWEFELVGTYRVRDDENAFTGFLFNYDYFDEARIAETEGIVSNFSVRVADPDEAGEVSARIDARFENSINPTRTATEAEANRQFAAQVGNIGLIMNSILSAVFFTILLLTGNTMAQALRERVPELAVLKTLGFTDRRVALLVLWESVLLCGLGGAAGIGLAVLVLAGLAPSLEAFLGQVEMSAATTLGGIGIAVLLGVVVGLNPALSARRLQVVEALRR